MGVGWRGRCRGPADAGAEAQCRDTHAAAVHARHADKLLRRFHRGRVRGGGPGGENGVVQAAEDPDEHGAGGVVGVERHDAVGGPVAGVERGRLDALHQGRLAHAGRSSDRLPRGAGSADGREELLRLGVPADEQAQRVAMGGLAEGLLEVRRFAQVEDAPEIGQSGPVVPSHASLLTDSLYDAIISLVAYMSIYQPGPHAG